MAKSYWEKKRRTIHYKGSVRERCKCFVQSAYSQACDIIIMGAGLTTENIMVDNNDMESPG